MTELSKHQYAKHRNVQPGVVYGSYTRNGYLVITSSGKVDVEKTDAILNARTRSDANRSFKAKLAGKPKEKSGAIGGAIYNKTEPAKMPDDFSSMSGSSVRQKALEIKEAYRAKLNQVEYEERVGILVPIEPLRNKIFEWARNLRDSILNFSNRYGAMITADVKKIFDEAGRSADQGEITIILDEYLTQFLQDLSRQLSIDPTDKG